MTTFTSKQIADLNGSMEAARLFGSGLGTEMSTLAGNFLIVSGSVIPADGEREVVDTGLTTVSHAVVSLSGSPSEDHILSTVTAGSVAGTIIIQSWDHNYFSASVAWSKVEWLAAGK